jgi:PadR family transcriptional regulator PadR
MKEARLIVVEGTLYPLLTRLKNAGLLNYKWEESKSGPPRKYYTLTAEGAEFLSALHSTWEELSGAVQTILKRKKTSN